MDLEDQPPEEVFGIVASEVRVEILRAFVDRRRRQLADAGPDEPENLPVALEFSELMAAVGLEDSGRFNYHLQQLLGTFVAETGDGAYRLTWAGQEIAGSILAGTYDGVELGPERIDSSCPACGEQFEASYESGRVTVACDDDHVAMATGLPSGAAEGRSMAELVDVAATVQFRETELVLDGVCPMCYGRVGVGVEEVEFSEAVSYQVEGVCERCGHLLRGSLAACVYSHPAVVAFYLEHGVDVMNARPWEIPFPDGDDAVEPAPGGGYEVRLAIDGDALLVTVGEDGDVVSTRRPDAG